MHSAPAKILISAGEASGEYYAAELVQHLRARWPGCEFFGAAGPRLRSQGIRAIIQSESLAVVGLVEVLGHLPRIWKLYRKLVRAIRTEKPDFAILTDSPDFHFRVGRQLKKLGVPVIYLVAPQVWAWRQGRVKTMRRFIDKLLVIFPFEKQWFQLRGVDAVYIGHPLAIRVRPGQSREEFFRKHNLPQNRLLVAVLPGSRRSEALRHLPELIRAADLLSAGRSISFVLPASPTCGKAFFEQPLSGSRIRAIEGEAWDLMAWCDVALAASGTVTVEAALLGAPMVTFYRVNPVSWWLGKFLVKVPFFSMVNLIAGKKIVPELMQDDMTGEQIAAAAALILDDGSKRARMKEELGAVATQLRGDGGDAVAKAAEVIEQFWAGRSASRVVGEGKN